MRNRETMYYACLAYKSNFKIEVTCSSETSVNFYQTTRCHIQVYNSLHSHCNEILINEGFVGCAVA
jgi:hypothetical protein